MDSNQLLKFKAIAELGTLTKAAEKLFVSQPALSYTIASLEKELDCQLFTRDKNYLILNENGKALLEYANNVSNILSRASLAIKDREKITLSSNNICASFILACYPQDLLENIKLIQAKESEFGDMLLKGTLDAATCDNFYIKITQQQHPEIVFEKHILCREELGVIVHEGHAFYSREYLTYKDLAGVPLCVHHDSNSFMIWINNIEEMNKTKFNFVFSMDHYTQYYLRDKIDYPELAVRNSVVANPLHEQKRKYKFIRIKDLYSNRNIYLWNLKEKNKKIQPLLDSVKEFYAIDYPLRNQLNETDEDILLRRNKQ